MKKEKISISPIFSFIKKKRENLYITDFFAARKKSKLLEFDIKYILVCGVGMEEFHKKDFKYKTLPVI